ncbi:MAG: dTMP kinase [Candidatus Magnetoglobus multicellularis str. Araruama]|uniref:dTMP kinase n=1 Tax=Candidatus Magnetoglobus multicellularis str. Araruama TaxID=890399 RepID=A0A1V1NU35_9BACT|nr:MAG: dTMP kinase [Candidatus Magnetoglobus multicellularis str. Araruama]
MLLPETFHLLQATEFYARFEGIILPALKAGKIVLCDRYVYTGLARDVARGCAHKWVANTYSYALKPDLAFYFKVPTKLALERILAFRKPNYYEAGMDLGISDNYQESFILFQSKVAGQYTRIVEEFDLHLIDAQKTIREQQLQLRKVVSKIIRRKNINDF